MKKYTWILFLLPLLLGACSTVQSPMKRKLENMEFSKSTVNVASGKDHSEDSGQPSIENLAASHYFLLTPGLSWLYYR